MQHSCGTSVPLDFGLDMANNFAKIPVYRSINRNLIPIIHANLKVPTITEEITKFSVKYGDKITNTPKRTCIHTT
jgi:hypothetical protein